MNIIFRYSFLFISLLLILSFALSCNGDETIATENEIEFLPPEWAVNANIYKVNIRHYTPEGTFSAFTEDLPRLQEMGVTILWLMPVHPIGEENRKGALGSNFSIADYAEINPEFGTKEEFRIMVDKAKGLGMRVIMDWVANHTAWDAVWTETNPEFYKTDEEGNFYPPNPDWDDVIQLDVEDREMWEEMISAMEYWVEEYNIDGYHASVADMVPTEFWIKARERLEAIMPVFMLAESEEPELHRAFDMTYALDYAQTIQNIGSGEVGLSDLDAALERNFERFEKKNYRMLYTINYEKNSLQGSDPELYADNFKNFAVLSATVWGMPLIYNGQESGLDRRLETFEKDEIDWIDYKYQDFYTTLLDLNTRNQALFNGEIGGDFRKLSTDKDEHIFSYKRIGHHEQVMVILNFSDEERTFSFTDGHEGTWMDVFDGVEEAVSSPYSIEPNSYRLFERVYMSH
ncbi:MAG: alpha-amylase [Balneolaceae bacterium]|nr:alpha-amylase [Balneolaceae bacterium]